MKTAIEWYSDKLLEILGDKVNEFTKEQTLANHYALKQAKEIEKQQMKDAVLSQCTTHEGLRKIFDKQFEQYFTETFKTK